MFHAAVIGRLLLVGPAAATRSYTCTSGGGEGSMPNINSNSNITRTNNNNGSIDNNIDTYNNHIP